MDVYLPYTAKVSSGKLSQLCTKYIIHWKTFMVHQAVAIMCRTQQVIQGENFRDWLKNRENRKFSHLKVLPYTVFMKHVCLYGHVLRDGMIQNLIH